MQVLPLKHSGVSEVAQMQKDANAKTKRHLRMSVTYMQATRECVTGDAARGLMPLQK